MNLAVIELPFGWGGGMDKLGTTVGVSFTHIG